MRTGWTPFIQMKMTCPVHKGGKMFSNFWFAYVFCRPLCMRISISLCERTHSVLLSPQTLHRYNSIHRNMAFLGFGEVWPILNFRGLIWRVILYFVCSLRYPVSICTDISFIIVVYGVNAFWATRDIVFPQTSPASPLVYDLVLVLTMDIMLIWFYSHGKFRHSEMRIWVQFG